MNKFDKNSIRKGQPKGCPLLFIPIILTISIAILPACSKKSIENTASQVQSSDTQSGDISNSLNNLYAGVAQNTYPNLSPDTCTVPQVQIKKTHYKTFVNQARNIDISTPVGFRLEKSDSNEIIENRTVNDEILFFLYHGNQDIKKVISFYKRELEILGWDFKDLSTKQEGLFICNKSSKTCVVSIRPKEICGSIICITITNKFDQN